MKRIGTALRVALGRNSRVVIDLNVRRKMSVGRSGVELSGQKNCAECSTPLPHFRVFYNKSAFFSRKDVGRISIRSPASSALGAARVTMTLMCSNIERKIRALGLIPSNIQVNYHFLPKVVNALRA